MNIANLPVPMKGYIAQLKSGPIKRVTTIPTENAKKNTDVLEIAPKTLTPLEQLYEDIKQVAIQNAGDLNSNLNNYLVIRDSYMEQNVCPKSPSRSEVMEMLAPLVNRMPLGRVYGSPDEKPDDFFTMAIKAVFPDSKNKKEIDNLFSDISVKKTLTFPIEFSVDGINVKVVDPGYMLVFDQNGEQILSYSDTIGGGAGWLPDQTMAEKMFIHETNLLYRKTYDATLEKIETQKAEQAAKATKPTLNMKV